MIRNLYRQIRQLFWLLPGFLLWAAFPPMGEALDVLFALSPLLWLVRNADVRTNVRCWAANGMLFWVATLSWMPAIVKNGGPWPLVVLGWGALSAYCTLYFAAFGYLGSQYWQWARIRGGYGWRLLGLLVVEPVLWAGLEIVRSRFGGGFAWNQLGVALVNAGFGSPAALGGVYLVSALVILVSGTFASIAERMIASFRRQPLERWRSIETLVPILLVLGVFWAAKGPLGQVGQLGRETLKVAMIQRNFPCCFKAQDEDPVAVYSNLLQNVELLRPDLIVLPESAMSEFGAIDGRNARAFANWVSSRTGYVLAGGGRAEAGKMYNSAAIYNGHLIQIYDKVHLVPFGEFIPGDKWIPALQKLAPVGSCTPGELKLLGGAGVVMGVAICFEDTDSAQMRRLAEMGAQLLVFITNDSWFSHSDEAVQHAWQARARAIETGLPVVRVGNSGVTGTIQPDGTVCWLIGEDGKPLVDAQGTMFDKVKVRGEGEGGLTPYVLLGDLPLGIAFALLIGAMILVKYKNYAKRRALSV